MNPYLAYVAGVCSVPLTCCAVFAWASAAETGTEIECRVCGYSTGPIRETRRIVCWVRWRWHKLATGHHTRRWLRKQAAL